VENGERKTESGSEAANQGSILATAPQFIVVGREDNTTYTPPFSNNLTYSGSNIQKDQQSPSSRKLKDSPLPKINYPFFFTKEIDGAKICIHSYFEPEESIFLPGVREKYYPADFDLSIENLNKRIADKPADIKIVIARVNDMDIFTKEIKGVDLVIPGRYHDKLSPEKITRINGVSVLPFINSRYMGAARIRINRDSRGKVRVKFSIKKPGKSKMPKNASLKPYLDEFYAKFGKNYDKIHTAFIGYGHNKLTHTKGKPRETPTAFVVADMIRDYAKTDVALINLFSIRRPLAGIIRGEDIEWIAPFGNKLVTMDLTGEQIEQIMKLNLRRDTKFIIISGGSIKYGPGEKITLYINGYPVDPKKTYRAAINDYMMKADKMEYKVFKLGKNVRRTKIPINGIFFEAVLKRRYICLPPERVGLKSREEIEKIKDPANAGIEAYKWGFYDIAVGMLEKAIKNDKNSPTVYPIAIISDIYLYSGLPGKVAEIKNMPKIPGSDWKINKKEAGELEKEYLWAKTVKSIYLNQIVSLYDLYDFHSVISLGQDSPFYQHFLESRPPLSRSLEYQSNKASAIFIASANYRLGNIKEADIIWKRISEQCPTDIRLRRLAEAANVAVAQQNDKTGTTPIWAKFKGDNQNTGRSPYSGPNSSKVKILWKFKTNHSIKSSPAIGSDGTIYLGGGDGIFYALSPKGKLKWKYTLGGYILSSPAIDKNSVIYVGSGNQAGGKRRQTFREGREEETEKTGSLCAFDADGTLKWKAKTGGWVASSPLITKDGNIVAGCNDHFVYCFDSNGNVKWKYETGDKVFSSPAEDKEGNIYIGSEDFYFYSLDSNGKFRWKYKAENKFFSSPAISDKAVVYVGNDDNHLYAFQRDGKLLWKKEFPEAITSTPSIAADGDIYVGCEDGKLYRMTPDGRIKWTFDREEEFFSSPIIDKNGNIYIGCEDNFLYCISPMGKLIWKFETGDYLESTPVVAPGGKIYICAEDRFFYVLVEDGGE